MEKSHYIGIIAVLVLLNLLVFSCQTDKTTTPNHTEVVDESTVNTDSNSEDAASEKIEDESGETADSDASNENAEETEDEEKIVAENEADEKPAAMNTPAAPPRTKTAKPKKPRKPAGPVAKFKFDKKEHNFGTVEVGTKVEYDFYFTNVGDVPLVIRDASSTCGCTIPEVPKAPTPPGGRGKVKVTFDSTGKIGMQDKHVTIVANTYPKNTVIHMKGLALTSNMMSPKKTTTTTASPYSSPKLSQPATTPSTPAAAEEPVKKEIPVKDEGSGDGGNSSLMSTTDKPSESPASAEDATIDNKDQ